MSDPRTPTRDLLMIIALACIIRIGPACDSSSPPTTVSPDATSQSLLLVDDYRIVAAQDATDPATWKFSIAGTSGPPDPTLRFEWQFAAGLQLEGLEQTYVFGSTGTYPVRVRVLDADNVVLLSLETEVDVVIPLAPNVAPIAVAGNDVEVAEGDTVLLDGSASSDPDSFDLRYAWRQTGGEPVAMIAQSDQPVATLTAPLVDADTVLEMTLTVSDALHSTTDVVQVRIIDASQTSLDPAALPPSDGSAATGGGGSGSSGTAGGGSAGGGGGGTGGGGSTGGGGAGGGSAGSGSSGGSTPLLDNEPHATVTASTEADLRAAAHLSFDHNVTVLVTAPITVSQMVSFSNSSVVRLLGVGDHPTITFNMAFDGDWSDPGTYALNGLRFANRQAVVRNLTFAGFNLQGSVLKGHVSQLLDVSDCVFRDNGNIAYPFRIVPPADANDAIFTQVIGGHDLTDAHINVAGNTFLRDSSNNQRWSHCLYMSARSISATDNTFDQCGNPYSIGSHVPGSTNTIVGSTIRNPVASPDPDGINTPAFLASLGDEDYTAYMYNTVSGQFHAPWTGSPNVLRHYVGQNDYTNMTYSGVWASDTKNALQIVWNDWLALGLDAGPDQVPASTVTVRSQSELQSAAARTATESLNILIDVPITLTQPLVFPASASVVRLMGIGDHPAITFQMPFDGNYADPSGYAVNGIELNSRTAFVRNLTLQDFNLSGAAIMGRNSALLHVSDCAFRRCGNVAYPPRVSPPVTPQDVIHTFCVAARANADAHVAVTGCTFDQCATNQWEWSRCVSLGGRSVSVMDNTFTGCATPFDIGGRYVGSGNNIMGNDISQPVAAINAAGQPVAPRLADLHDDDHTVFGFNTVSGAYNEPWHYSAETANHYVGQNDYTNMTYTGAWATNPSDGSTLTLADWQALGFDP